MVLDGRVETLEGTVSVHEDRLVTAESNIEGKNGYCKEILSKLQLTCIAVLISRWKCMPSSTGFIQILSQNLSPRNRMPMP